MLVGVLALQGAFAAHRRVLTGLGVDTREVRVPVDLTGLDALVLPGGESTTMTLGIEREGLAGPLAELVAAGTPVLGTCAGMILLDADHLALADWRCRRNAFGRQVRSFELDLTLSGEPGLDDEATTAVFIRAPWVESHGPDVTVLARVEDHPVVVRQRDVLGVAFHPELGADLRFHRWLLRRAAARSAAPDPAPG